MTYAYEHGRNAQHGKHIQTCPFDTGTNEWRSWRNRFDDPYHYQMIRLVSWRF
jgi:hypothetical protein